MIKRQDIVDEARSHVGTPWVHQGRQPGVALDCAGLIAVVGKNLGATIHDYTEYSRDTYNNDFLIHFDKAGLRTKPTSQMAPGDILIFKHGQFVCHGGIVVHRGLPVDRMVHAFARPKVMRTIEERLTPQFLQAMPLMACYEYPGVEPWE